MKDIYSDFTVNKNRLYNTCDVKVRKFSKILSQKCAFFPRGNVLFSLGEIKNAQINKIPD